MGRATKQQAAANRERVVTTAARLFRERGLAGVGIAELMAEAGLTHGGFYRQFPSKDVLAGEACAKSMASAAQSWRTILAEQDVATLVDRYLRKASNNNCAMPTLAGDAAREPPGSPVRQAFTDGVREFADVLASAEAREQALALLAAMVGAVAIARAIDDPALSGEIMQAVRAMALTSTERDSGERA